jgi:hypothetical protein
LKADSKACNEWNQEQVAKASAVIDQERAAGNEDALDKSSANENEDFIKANCPGTITGCSQQDGTIGVNADRNPAAISQTIVHERHHAIFWGTSRASETCARWRAVRYVGNMSNANRKAATSGHIPAYTTTSGSAAGCF